MKKFLMTLMAAMLLLSSTTYAVEVSKAHNPAKQMITMSKAETLDMLKDAGIEAGKVKMLDNGEMVQTDAEGIYGAWIGGLAYLLYYGYDYYQTGEWHGSVSGFGAAAGAGYVLLPI